MKTQLMVSLGVSLMLTLLLEIGFALVWGVRGKDLRLTALVNVLTNPVVVLCYHLAVRFLPAGVGMVVLGTELWAVVTEGYLYHSRSGIKHPWLFAVCANLMSWLTGYII